ncbi:MULTISPECIES: hypothetical protein [unclassified Achromobacter]|uniref:hypothetical protein n=1 Tax=unclassified Achromobacter TaxID=2626865 RepID=UPI00117843B2|nr:MULTISPECIES: hypothetical protein [unclassified Achromobacter]
MKIDTEIRSVTQPLGNNFLEPSNSAKEASGLRAAPRREINDTRLLKEQLLWELAEKMAHRNLREL